MQHTEKLKHEAQGTKHEEEPWSWLSILGSRRFWQRVAIAFLCLVFLFSTASYGIALWYQHSQKGKPYELGVSFIPSYAAYLGVDPQETLNALIHDLGIKRFRFVSYWDQIETSPGTYDFSQLDWQMAVAQKAGAQVSLSLGLRQPRWPECHAPSWVDTAKPARQWQPALERVMEATVKRYRTSPALESYQLENEYFLQGFGACQNHDRQRLIDEYALVKHLDSRHPVIITRSNNGVGWPTGAPTPDKSGISIYQRVWDSHYTHRYITYPVPSWYYSSLLGLTKLMTGQDTFIHELQAEAWAPNYQSILETSLTEQNKSFDAARLKNTIQFAKDIGPRQVYLWGAEYWYYRDQVLHDPSVWDEAAVIFRKS